MENKLVSVRYFIQLSYNGKKFHGWQIQPNAISVQEELNKALTTILRESVNVVGAGRTDTGVHASFFVAHFDVNKKIENCQHLTFKLNSFLLNDVKIEKIIEVSKLFHARFSPVARTYHYFVSPTKVPFLSDFVAVIHYQLNVKQMNEAAQVLLNYTDFTSFSKLHTDVKTNLCQIESAQWTEKNGLLIFEIKADRFLRNMVRAIVGTLVEVGRGNLTVEDVHSIIQQKNRGVAGASVKAHGLFLTDICYPDEIEIQLVKKNHFLL